MTAVENKEIKEIMEELDDGDKEIMLLSMLIKTTVDSIMLSRMK